MYFMHTFYADPGCMYIKVYIYLYLLLLCLSSPSHTSDLLFVWRAFRSHRFSSASVMDARSASRWLHSNSACYKNTSKMKPLFKDTPLRRMPIIKGLHIIRIYIIVKSFALFVISVTESYIVYSY